MFSPDYDTNANDDFFSELSKGDDKQENTL